MTNKDLLSMIKADTTTCFKVSNIFEFEEKLYEPTNEEATEFRVILHWDHYDYVEDILLNQVLAEACQA